MANVSKIIWILRGELIEIFEIHTQGCSADPFGSQFSENV